LFILQKLIKSLIFEKSSNFVSLVLELFCISFDISRSILCYLRYLLQNKLAKMMNNCSIFPSFIISSEVFQLSHSQIGFVTKFEMTKFDLIFELFR
jgi:hypothetical protein